jgi:hypothetical protein
MNTNCAKQMVALAIFLLPFTDAFGQTSTRKVIPHDRKGDRPALLRPPPNQTAVWYSVESEGMPVDFLAYNGPLSSPPDSPCSAYPYICELRQTTATSASVYNMRPPMTFTMPPSINPAPETPIYGCNEAGFIPPPSIFTIASRYSGVTGLRVQGAAVGSALNSAPGAYAVMGAYVSSNRCSESDQEYGFTQNLTNPGEWDFYYSQYTNTERQLTSPITAITGINASEGYYSMYIVPSSQAQTIPGVAAAYYFRIQVLSTNHTLDICRINGSDFMPCSTDVPIDETAYQWSVSSMIDTPGYAITYTQVSAPPSPAPTYQQAGTWTVLDVALNFEGHLNKR